MQQSKAISVLGIVFLISLSACQKASHDAGKSLPPVDVKRLQSISYNMVNDYVFQPYCANCHSGEHSPNLTSYYLVVKQIGSIESVVFNPSSPKKQMPPSSKPQPSADMKALLQLWIDNSAPLPDTKINNGGGGVVPPGKPITYGQLFKQVVQQNCTHCHKPGNKWKLKDYTDVEQFKKQIGSVVETVILNEMPPREDPPNPPLPHHWMEDEAAKPGVNKKALTDQEKRLIVRWVNGGMLD